MKKLVSTIIILLASILQADQKIDSFCGFRLGENITNLIQRKVVFLSDERFFYFYLDKPFRCFTEATIALNEDHTVRNILLKKDFKLLEASTNDVSLEKFNAQNKPYYYNAEQATNEFYTLVKMVETKFGKPDRKETGDEANNRTPFRTNNLKPLSENLFYGNTRIRLGLFFVDNGQLGRGLDPNAFRGLKLKEREELKRKSENRPTLYNCHLSISFGESQETRMVDRVNEGFSILKNRCREFSQEEIDAL